MSLENFLYDYAGFLLKAITLVISILIVVFGIFAIRNKGHDESESKIRLKKLNEYFDKLTTQLQKVICSKKEFRALQKQRKLQKKSEKSSQRKIFVVDFQGDIRARGVHELREEISAILHLATKEDEIVVRLESPGGMVQGYGLGASQLQRIRDREIPLTVCVDKVAASGGYLMACVADKILAAPFAIIGSVGVVAQFPNFHRYLKKHDIDYEQITAGEFKRTMTIFGENTKPSREKFKEDLTAIHIQFKNFIKDHRPQVDVDRIATGEHWLATQAKREFQLVDGITTSDDYLMAACKDRDVFEVKTQKKKSWQEKLMGSGAQLWQQIYKTSPFSW